MLNLFTFNFFFIKVNLKLRNPYSGKDMSYVTGNLKFGDLVAGVAGEIRFMIADLWKPSLGTSLACRPPKLTPCDPSIVPN